MTIEAVTLGSGDRHAAPVDGGPIVEMVRAATPDRQIAVLHVTVPPGGGMPEHAHGPSEVLLIPQDGVVRLIPADGDPLDLGPGTLGSVPVGERVALQNATDEPVRLLVVLAPTGFAASAAAWPAAPGDWPAARGLRGHSEPLVEPTADVLGHDPHPLHRRGTAR